MLTGHDDGRLPRWLVALPYVVGILHLVAFNILFRLFRGTFFGGDSAQFLAIAEAIRSGALLEDPTNAKPLGYPLAIALTASLPGSAAAHALLINALGYLLTIGLIGRMARLLNCSPRVSRIVQISFALIPNTAAWANLVYSDTMAMALLVGSLWCLLTVLSRPRTSGWTRPVMALGGLLGLLSLTRSEYVLLIPITTLVLLVSFLRSSMRRALGRVALLWACSLPILMIQPTISGWRGPGSVFPPNQTGFVDLWRSWYDLEFTQLRFHELDDLARLACTVPEDQLPLISQRVHAFKYTTAREDTIDNLQLDRLDDDLGALRQLVLTQGRSFFEACQTLALSRIARDPVGYLSRTVKRLWLFLTGADLDWPTKHPAHWLYTWWLRPWSMLAFFCLVALLLVTHRRIRWTVLLLGLWTMFPSLAHSAFVFEQRFAYPSVPLLSVIVGLAIQRAVDWRSPLVSVCDPAIQGLPERIAPPPIEAPPVSNR